VRCHPRFSFDPGRRASFAALLLSMTCRALSQAMPGATATRVFIVACIAMLAACSDDPVSPTPPTPSVDIDWAPRWSPDGAYILYYHFGVVAVKEDGYVAVDMDSIGLWVTRSDGSARRMLIRGIAIGGADWAPQSDSIVYSFSSQIYRAAFTGTSIDSTSIQQLTTSGWNVLPAWSPDGQWIAYDLEQGPFKTAIMRADGTDKRVIEHTGMGDWRGPDWSPAGRICHTRYPPGTDGTSEIFTMDDDGTNVVRVTDNKTGERWPQFSPDGTKIAYWTTGPGEVAVWIVDADGTNPVRLAPGGHPSWSPDGEWIAFARPWKERTTIWKMRVDGSELVQVTFGP
jgi:TolB protein